MNRRILVLGLLSVLIRPDIRLQAQSARVEPKSEIVLKRDAMDTANAAWNETDRGLEKSIFREDPAAATKRLLTAASKRREFDQARQVYYDALVRDARQQLSAFQVLSKRSSGSFPRETMTRTITTQLEQLMSREASLNRELADKDPKTDPARRRLVEEQIKNQLEQLAKLRTNLYERKQILSSMEAPEATVAAAGKALLEHTQDVIRMLESNSQQVRDEAATWDEYYGTLNQLVSSRQKPNADERENILKKDAKPKQ